MKSDAPYFSIVTPSLNSNQHIRACVGSLRTQIDVTLQHLIQDGLSDDGTAEWLKAQPDLDVRIEADQGMYDAIARGWARSRGQVIAWLNADEQYLPGTLLAVKELFESSPDVDVVYGDVIVINETGEPIAARRLTGLLSAKEIANSYLNVFSCTMFFRRRLLEAGALIFEQKYRYAADMDLVLRLLMSGVKFCHLPKYLALFKITGGNLSSHRRMREETGAIRRQFGGSNNPIGRRISLLPFYLRRFLNGAYRTESIDYLLATDDRPRHRQIHHTTVGWRYRT